MTKLRIRLLENGPDSKETKVIPILKTLYIYCQLIIEAAFDEKPRKRTVVLEIFVKGLCLGGLYCSYDLGCGYKLWNSLGWQKKKRLDSHKQKFRRKDGNSVPEMSPKNQEQGVMQVGVGGNIKQDNRKSKITGCG